MEYTEIWCTSPTEGTGKAGQRHDQGHSRRGRLRRGHAQIRSVGRGCGAAPRRLLVYDWRLALLSMLFPPISYWIAERMKTVIQRAAEGGGGAAQRGHAGSRGQRRSAARASAGRTTTVRIRRRAPPDVCRAPRIASFSMAEFCFSRAQRQRRMDGQCGTWRRLRPSCPALQAGNQVLGAANYSTRWACRRRIEFAHAGGCGGRAASTPRPASCAWKRGSRPSAPIRGADLLGPAPPSAPVACGSGSGKAACRSTPSRAATASQPGASVCNDRPAAHRRMAVSATARSCSTTPSKTTCAWATRDVARAAACRLSGRRGVSHARGRSRASWAAAACTSPADSAAAGAGARARPCRGRCWCWTIPSQHGSSEAQIFENLRRWQRTAWSNFPISCTCSADGSGDLDERRLRRGGRSSALSAAHVLNTRRWRPDRSWAEIREEARHVTLSGPPGAKAAFADSLYSAVAPRRSVFADKEILSASRGRTTSSAIAFGWLLALAEAIESCAATDPVLWPQKFTHALQQPVIAIFTRLSAIALNHGRRHVQVRGNVSALSLFTGGVVGSPTRAASYVLAVIWFQNRGLALVPGGAAAVPVRLPPGASAICAAQLDAAARASGCPRNAEQYPHHSRAGQNADARRGHRGGLSR